MKFEVFHIFMKKSNIFEKYEIFWLFWKKNIKNLKNFKFYLTIAPWVFIRYYAHTLDFSEMAWSFQKS